ncbi:MAG TPA: glycosyltransferase [Gemmatimonadaceae bacterium]|nr:glycosyltransferase [Gemmatimonadaceae bacterium]
MRICFVCSDYPPGPHGGIGTMTQLLARALVRAGHEARVAGVYSPSYPAPDRANDEGVGVWRLREPAGRTGWIRARRRLFSLIAGWSRAGEIDLVEVPDWEGWATGWPALPVPVVARLNGSATYFAAELGAPVRWHVRQLEQWSLGRSDFWCSASRYTADRTRLVLSPKGPPDAILYNPVELPPVASSGERSRDTIVFSGTLTEKKGVVQLVRAWPIVARAFPRAELRIFGKDGVTSDGRSMREQLEALLQGERGSERVHFHGHVSRAELKRALAAARAAVFPSYAEAFALAPLEAMAAGCPTIYSTRGSGPELIDDGRDGLLVDPDEPEQIAAALSRVLEDDALAAALGAAGRRRVEESFSLDVALERNVEFYARCIRSFAARPRQVLDAATRRAHTTAPLHLGDCSAEHAELDAEPQLTRGLSVVICTYRRPESVRRFVDSLSSQSAPVDELVIVDASPDDATERMLREQPELPRTSHCTRYYRVDGPAAGLTRQRNTALRVVTRDLVAFFDDDVVLRPGCLAEIERGFRESNDRIVGVGAYIENDQAPPSALWRIRATLGIVPSLRPGSYTRSGISIPWRFLPPTEELVEGDWLPGCSMAWRTGLARALGFNESFHGYANGEDLEFSRGMARHGRIVVAGRARLLHMNDAGGRPDMYQMGYIGMRNQLYIHRTWLQDRGRMDVAWWTYASVMDTLVRFVSLAKPRNYRVRWSFVRGRIRFLHDLVTGAVR